MEKSTAEKSPFSKLTHVGVVVRDLDKAIDYLSSLGLGPFESLRPSRPLGETLVRGKPAEVKVKISAAKVGQVRLEFIQPIEGESPTKEFLDKKGEGINHIGFAVDDLDKEIAKLTKQGVKILTSARWEGGSLVSAYLETDTVGGIIIELSQGEESSHWLK